MQEVTEERLRGKRLALLSLTVLGVVYGDIGTSPLYAIRECFHGQYGVEPTSANILGVMSLMFWTLVLIVCVKYLGFILRADNRGEGGVIALAAQLIQSGGRKWTTGALVLVGLFGAALLYGDGMITPAISVLSAVEGLGVAVPALRAWIEVVTIAILAALFLLQRRGTHAVGVLFGPITTLWFLVIAALGVRGLASRPEVLLAVNPLNGVAFLERNALVGFVVLGAVFLVVTGTEALFADMGHFGRRPIRVTWYALVLPALLCNYFGQAALLMDRPEAYHPFYALAPLWAVLPLVGLATAATIIASQAVISGAFSLTRQAIQLGYLPRLSVIHTSPTEIGQIYIPQVNWILMLATIGLVLGFQSSSQLAAAYGVAVTATMAISSVLFFAVARRRWKWSLWCLIPMVGIFLAVDLTFFAANIGKIGHGAWFPLVVGGIIFAMMTTWRKGRAILSEKLYAGNPKLEQLVADLNRKPPLRVSGKALYMAGNPCATPPALVHNLKHNKVLHEHVAVVTIVTEDIPRVARDEKVQVQSLGSGFWCVSARYGFMEEPNVPHLLALAREKGLDFQLDEVVFFLGRERIMPDRRPRMSRWREALFSFLSLNALGATRHFKIPAEQVVEIGTQVEI